MAEVLAEVVAEVLAEALATPLSAAFCNFIPLIEQLISLTLKGGLCTT